MVVKSSLLFFSLNIGMFSVILYKGFRSNSIDFGGVIIFGNVAVSDHRAQMPIKKFLKYSPIAPTKEV